jgi:lysophospholipase L1-like esterase
LAKLDDGEKTRFLDIGSRFLNDDGSLPRPIMRDFLHPTAAGYQIWADAMAPLLDDMLR